MSYRSAIPSSIPHGLSAVARAATGPTGMSSSAARITPRTAVPGALPKSETLANPIANLQSEAEQMPIPRAGTQVGQIPVAQVKAAARLQAAVTGAAALSRPAASTAALGPVSYPRQQCSSQDAAAPLVPSATHTASVQVQQLAGMRSSAMQKNSVLQEQAYAVPVKQEVGTKASALAPPSAAAPIPMHLASTPLQPLMKAAVRKPAAIADLVSTANAMLRPELQITEVQQTQLEQAVGGTQTLMDLLHDNFLNEVLQTDGKLSAMQLVAVRRVLNSYCQ